MDLRLVTLQLIEKYVAAVRSAVEAISYEYDLSNPLRSVNRGEIPREGTLTNGTTFSFHGIGCSVESDKVTVTFDFGPDGRYDGFSLDALTRFASDNDLDTGLSDQQLKDEYKKLISDGTIIEPQWDPGRHLNYMRTTMTTP